MFYVYSSRPSRSARVLARALKGRRINSTERIRPEDTVINWGDSRCPIRDAINKPEVVAVATNKLKAFDVLAASTSAVLIPRFARRKEDVTWKGLTVVRHKLQGHSGDGIEIIDGGEFPEAPLYVEYIKKEQEYRVHVVGSQVVLVQRKARRRDIPNDRVDWRVRNHANGFIYQRHGVEINDAVTRSAIDTIRIIGLDFGAVDLIQKKDGKVYVLEVNTAPGMEGSTVNDYAQSIKSYANSRLVL